MQMPRFRDGKGNQYQDMYTLSMSDEFARNIGGIHFFNDKIYNIIIRSKYNTRFGNKIIKIPYESEFYTFREGYIFRYVLGRVEIQKSYGCKGHYCFMYYLHNVYKQKQETIESAWYIFGLDRMYMAKKDIRVLLKNYRRKDARKFVEEF